MSEIIKNLVSLISSHDNDNLSSILQFLSSSQGSTAFESQADALSILSIRTKKKYTVLHEAIFSKNVVALRLLVAFGADVNVKCHGTPPSHLCLTLAANAAINDGEQIGNTCLSVLLETGNVSIDAKDDQGSSMLHLASDFNNMSALNLIISSCQDDMDTLSHIINAKDRLGWCPIHKAIAQDNIEICKVLLDNGASLNSITSQGFTVGHVAVFNGSIKTLSMLTQSSDWSKIVSIRDIYDRDVYDTVTLYGYDIEVFTLDKALVSVDKSHKPHLTGIVTDSKCLSHHTCVPSEASTPSAPPENLHRLEVLIGQSYGVLHSCDIVNHLQFVNHCQPASISDVLRVHEWSYVRKIQAKCESIDNDVSKDGGLGFLDGDTAVSHDSFNAALGACGAVCHAVDMVMSGAVKNCFCPIRPPGHHAGPRGVVKGKAGGPDSHGFCLLNNISVGAAYALNMYRNDIKKIAIVDFDVHHGNGTEETVRWLQPDVEEIEVSNDFFFSKLQAPRFKPWLSFNDHENVFFVSVHGYGPREAGMPQFMMPQGAFYPGSGATVMPPLPSASSNEETQILGKRDCDREEVNPIETSVRGSDHESEVNEGQCEIHEGGESEASSDDNEDHSHNMNEGQSESHSEESSENGIVDAPVDPVISGVSGLQEVYQGKPSHPQPLILDVGVNLPDSVNTSSSEYRHQWRNYFRQEIFPRLDSFEPDIIFISAGFDAHKKDTINSGYIALVEEDFEWVTTHLVRLANTHSKGRIVSALEGGYQLNGEYCSAFAKSVKAHVVALNGNCQSAYPGYIPADLALEYSHERQLLDELEAKRYGNKSTSDSRGEGRGFAGAKMFVQNNEGTTSDLVGGDDVPILGDSDVPAVDIVDVGSRKRRRAPVDYNALDQEFRQQSASTSSL